MPTRICFLTLVMMLMFSVLHSAAQPRTTVPLPGMLVSGDWLEAHLDHPLLVILHVGGEPDFAAGHLPGARLLTLADISVTGPTGLRLELPETAVLQGALGKLGISDQHRVVIYNGTDSVQSATRTWFTFDYLGIGSHAALLDGGLAVWKRDGRPVTQNTMDAPAARLSVETHAEFVTDLDWVRTQMEQSSVRLLDARTPNFYTGAEPGFQARRGRIPGAANLPFPTFFEESGRWRSPEALRSMLSEAMGGASLLVTYCHIGQQATVPYFAARLVGIDVKLFDGSFQAWSNEQDLPVAVD